MDGMASHGDVGGAEEERSDPRREAALAAALERAAALSGGCDAEARGAAEAALGRLRDPEAVRQREREARAAAAEARLGGLTPAQKAFMLRSKAGT